MSAHSGGPRTLDASSVISLLAIETELARAILSARGGAFVVTTEVMAEVQRDPRVPGQPASTRLKMLSDSLIERVTLGPSIAERFVELSALPKMGNGEASVLAYAEAMSGIAVLDDDDGRSGLVRVELEWTIDLLLHDLARQRIGAKQLADAVHDAGKLGRMRFPAHRRNEVIALIGEERARECPGLRRAFRRAR